MVALPNIDTLIQAALAESGPRSRLKKAAKERGVRDSAEFQRILALPRRTYTEAEGEAIADQLTEVLKTPNGKMRLRPPQAISLLEIGLYRRFAGPLRVGAGKTLVSFLAPYMLDSVRPLLILPASAIRNDVTRNRQKVLSEHWRIPYWNHLVSYQSLGRLSYETYLDDLTPDCLIADEAHMIANPRAGVTRRVRRYQAGDKAVGLEGHWVPFIPLSGTLTKRSIKDYSHLFDWALQDTSPVPRVWVDVEEWADVIDERPDDRERMRPGVLVAFSGGSEVTQDIREGFANRVNETPGVVATFDDGPSCSLEIYRVTIPVPKAVEASFEPLREHWCTPDGWTLMSGLEVAAAAKQLALGFYYRPKERPPEEWIKARREWQAFLRHAIRYNRLGLDTELAVAMACAHGKLDPTLWKAWKEIKPTYKWIKDTVWIDGYALEWAAQWLADPEPGILFCEHVEFAEALSELTGVPYCGEESTDANGVHIEAFAGQQSLIASQQSCHKIWNLQPWARACTTSPAGSGYIWEQWLGRMHRDLQKADLVRYEILVQCLEHSRAVEQAQRDAVYIQGTQTQVQKINLADWRWFDDPHRGPMWDKDWTSGKVAA